MLFRLKGRLDGELILIYLWSIIIFVYLVCVTVEVKCENISTRK